MRGRVSDEERREREGGERHVLRGREERREEREGGERKHCRLKS